MSNKPGGIGGMTPANAANTGQSTGSASDRTTPPLRAKGDVLEGLVFVAHVPMMNAMWMATFVPKAQDRVVHEAGTSDQEALGRLRATLRHEDAGFEYR